jgi:hypothetical protein
MRIDDGARALDEVAVHLTMDEAREVVRELTKLIGEMEFPGFEHNLGGVGRFDIHIYSDTAGLEEGFASGIGSVTPDDA